MPVLFFQVWPDQKSLNQMLDRIEITRLMVIWMPSATWVWTIAGPYKVSASPLSCWPSTGSWEHWECSDWYYPHSICKRLWIPCSTVELQALKIYNTILYDWLSLPTVSGVSKICPSCCVFPLILHRNTFHFLLQYPLWFVASQLHNYTIY